MSSEYFYSMIFQLVAGILPLVFVIVFNSKIPLSLIVFWLASFLSTLTILITCKIGINNLIIFNTFQGFSICCLSTFYYKIIKSSNFRYLVLTLSFISLIIYVTELTISNNLLYTLISENLCFISFSLLFYIDYFKWEINERNNQSFLLINTVIFVYNSFRLIPNLEIDLLILNQYWIIHNIVEGLSKLIIAFAIWKQPKTCNI